MELLDYEFTFMEGAENLSHEFKQELNNAEYEMLKSEIDAGLYDYFLLNGY